jgi:hypothetical protein
MKLYIGRCNTGNITITLWLRQVTQVKVYSKIDSTANTVTVTNSAVLMAQLQNLASIFRRSFQSNGTQYFIIGNFKL